MRGLILTLFLVTPAQAWEFSATPICTLRDDNAATAVTVTFDGALYTVRLSHPDGWPEAPVFAIRFAPNGPTISTDRHVIDGTDLSVSDRGFGNVLNGLQFNASATAILGDVARTVPLGGAAEPVAAFRACPAAPAA